MKNKFEFTSFTIASDEILENSVVYRLDINREENLCIGTVASAELSFTTTKSSLVPGDKFTSYYQLPNSSTWVKEGVFYIYSVTKNLDSYDVLAYDSIYLFNEYDTDFLTTVTFPITLGNLFSKLCTYYSLTAYSTTFTNSTYKITCTANDVYGKTNRQLLSWIAEASASSIIADKDAKLKVIQYTGTATAITSSDRYNLNITDYGAEKIDKVKVSYLSTDTGITVGTGDVQYNVVGNPLLLNCTTTEVTNIYNVLKAYDYYPMNVQVIPTMDLAVGSIVTIDGKTSYIMGRERDNAFIYYADGLEDYYRDLSTEDYSALSTGLITGNTHINGSCINVHSLTADAIYGGTLTLGGLNNKYGQLIMLDKDGKEIGNWDKDGIEVLEGQIHVKDSNTSTYDNSTFWVKDATDTNNAVYIGTYGSGTNRSIMTAVKSSDYTTYVNPDSVQIAKTDNSERCDIYNTGIDITKPSTATSDYFSVNGYGMKQFVCGTYSETLTGEFPSGTSRNIAATFRKWNTGELEAWYKMPCSNSSWQAYGPFYYKQGSFRIMSSDSNYKFTSIDSVTGAVINGDTNGIYGISFRKLPSEPHTIFVWSALQTSFDGYVSLYVKGKWK